MNHKSGLQFTGNWFIDAGILGFVNLMEEVYGGVWRKEWKEKNPNKSDWKFNFLEYLNEKIKENERLVYYGYFPFAFIFENIQFQLFKIKLNDLQIREIIKKIEKIKTDFLEKMSGIKSKDPTHIFEGVWPFIDRLCEDIWIEKKISLLDQEISKIKRLQKQRNFKDFKEKILEIKNLIISKEKEIRKILQKKEREKISYYELESSNFPEIKEKISNLRKCLEKWWKNKNKENTERIFFRLPISNKFFTNFLIFQESWSYNKQKEGFNDLIDFDIESQPTFLGSLDKFVNKFLPSEDEFSNINYTKFSTKIFKNQIKYFFVYLISFTHAFENFKNIGYVLFYSNDLKLTYFINKRLKLKKKKIEEKENKNSNVIFKITWNEIVNTLIEYKSEWSLENMYIIRYRRLDNQAQEDIEYIGIPKLQAQVLLDDHIRNALNQYIVIHKAGKNTIKKWILEEFISGKPLYPLAFQHIKTCLTNDINVNYFVFYSLLLDAAILEFKEKQKERRTTTLFSNEFLKGSYREIVQEVKREFSTTYYYTTQEIPKYFENKDEKKRFAYLLLDALHSQSKAEFLYILLKKLNTEKIIHKPALNWIFDKIIKNNISWKEYALLLTGGLVL